MRPLLRPLSSGLSAGGVRSGHRQTFATVLREENPFRFLNMTGSLSFSSSGPLPNWVKERSRLSRFGARHAAAV
jgi:hypothetical protein